MTLTHDLKVESNVINAFNRFQESQLIICTCLVYFR